MSKTSETGKKQANKKPTEKKKISKTSKNDNSKKKKVRDKNKKGKKQANKKPTEKKKNSKTSKNGNSKKKEVQDKNKKGKVSKTSETGKKQANKKPTEKKKISKTSKNDNSKKKKVRDKNKKGKKQANKKPTEKKKNSKTSQKSNSKKKEVQDKNKKGKVSKTSETGKKQANKKPTEKKKISKTSKNDNSKKKKVRDKNKKGKKQANKKPTEKKKNSKTLQKGSSKKKKAQDKNKKGKVNKTSKSGKTPTEEPSRGSPVPKPTTKSTYEAPFVTTTKPSDVSGLQSVTIQNRTHATSIANNSGRLKKSAKGFVIIEDPRKVQKIHSQSSTIPHKSDFGYIIEEDLPESGSIVSGQRVSLPTTEPSKTAILSGDGLNHTAAVGKGKADRHKIGAERGQTTSLAHARRKIHHLAKELRNVAAEEKGEEMADDRTVKLLLDRLRNSYSKDPIKSKDQKTNATQHPTTAHSAYVPVKVKTFGARLGVERLSGRPPTAPKTAKKKKKKTSFFRKLFPFHKRHQRQAGQ